MKKSTLSTPPSDKLVWLVIGLDRPTNKHVLAVVIEKFWFDARAEALRAFARSGFYEVESLDALPLRESESMLAGLLLAMPSCAPDVSFPDNDVFAWLRAGTKDGSPRSAPSIRRAAASFSTDEARVDAPATLQNETASHDERAQTRSGAR
jgi:hypothetical protein